MFAYELSQLNKAYFDLGLLTQSSDKPITILYGGRNSSKTYSCIQWLVKKIWNEQGASAVWYRNEGSVLRTKAYNPIKQFIENHGIDSHLKFSYHNQAREISFPNGNVLYFDFCEGGKSKGMANVRYVIIDEIDQLSKANFMMILSSYRADDKIRFIFMFNPVSDKHWLKKTFFDKPKTEEEFAGSLYNMTNRRKYTIEDNKFATAMDYKILDSYKFTDENEYRIARLGEWGTLQVENPFYHRFVYNVNTAEDVPYFEEYPIYLSFDFGKYDTCVLGQHFQDYEIGSDFKLASYFHDKTAANTRLRDYRQIDTKNPLRLRDIIHNIVLEFGTDKEYIIYGDTSGGSDEWSKFAEIRNYMEDAGCDMLSFPRRIKLRHKSNGAITNWCLAMYGDNYKIDRRCDLLIHDLLSVKTDDFGNIDKNDAVKWDISHISDCSRYLDVLTDGLNFVRNNAYFAEKELGREVGLIE
jgi:PBSX family phage terminase large subunit